MTTIYKSGSSESQASLFSSSTDLKPDLSIARRVAIQVVKFLARVVIFTAAVGGGAMLGSLIPIPVWGTAFGAAVGFALAMGVHNKAMSLIDQWMKPSL